MKKNLWAQGGMRSTKHIDIQQEPRRVASRMEGVVKNVGTKPKKKKSKG
jgi:hypothetical protein